MRHNGAFELRFLNWVSPWESPRSAQPVAAARAASDPAAALALADRAKHVVSTRGAAPTRGNNTPEFAPDYEEWLIDAMSGDDRFLEDMGVDVTDHLREYRDDAGAHMTGWYDSWGLRSRT